MNSLFSTVSALLGANDTPKPPSEQDVVIEKLIVYPIKSCMGASVDSVEVLQDGFEYDRKWLIIDVEKGTKMSARDNRGIKLVRIQVEVQKDVNAKYGGVLLVSSPESAFPSFRVPLDPTPEDVKDWKRVGEFEFWGDKMDALQVPPYEDDPDPSEVLSTFTGHPAKLAMRPPVIREVVESIPFRPIQMFSEHQEKLQYEGGVQSQFQDIGPLMLASVESLKHAQESIAQAAREGKVSNWDPDQEVTIDRWRPNIIVSGVGKPFEEDEWKEGEVGEEHLPFIFPHPTPRCMFPNVDPHTGIRHPQVPWSVLMKYRKILKDGDFKNKYFFGVYGIPVMKSGTIRVGDKIHITKHKALD